MEKNTKKFAIGTAIAAVAGYLAGILTAPKSGKETRQDVKNTAIKAKTEAEKDLKKLHSEITDQINRAKKIATKFGDDHKKDIDKLMSKASVAKEKAREVLSAVHDGKSDNKELSAVIKDINNATDELRKYLDKIEVK